MISTNWFQAMSQQSINSSLLNYLMMNVVLMNICREATKFSCYHCMCTYFLNGHVCTCTMQAHST